MRPPAGAGPAGVTTMPVDATGVPCTSVVRYITRQARASNGTPTSSSLRTSVPGAPSVASAGGS